MTLESGGGGPNGRETGYLTFLIPPFGTSTDYAEVWPQKVGLLSKVWPGDKITEGITRLMLNCKAPAFHKLQIKQQKFLKNYIK